MTEFVNQSALTIVVKVKPNQEQPLRDLLKTMVAPHADVETNSLVPFEKLSTVHFARFVVLDQSLSENETLRKIRPLLVFSSNYDGKESKHLEELVDVAGEGFDQIFSHCEGYPAKGKRDKKSRIRFLKKHREPYGAFHCGAQGMSVARIKQEGRLRDHLESYIDQNKNKPEWKDNPVLIRSDIRDHIKQTAYSWALKPPENAPLSWKIFRGNGWQSIAWLVVKLVLSLPFIPLVMIILRHKEKRDKVFSKIRYNDRAKELAAREDKVVQNQMTNLVDMKPGLFRQYTLRLFFTVIEVLARYYFTKGKLGSIPTIHFARWVFVDDGKALLFFSNYGSSWESYLGDFVDKASEGLTGVWSNTARYPKSKWLILEGATDEERFKCWARAQQMPTDVWYSAYKTLTVKNILMNKTIREGLSASTMTKEQTIEWLKLF